MKKEWNGKKLVREQVSIEGNKVLIKKEKFINNNLSNIRNTFFFKYIVYNIGNRENYLILSFKFCIIYLFFLFWYTVTII